MNIGHNNNYRSPMPEENCPPGSSQSKDIEKVYRLALNNPPIAEDFLSHIESGKQYPPGSDCEAASISVYKKMEDVIKQKRKIPVYRKNGYISEGTIKHNTGVVHESKTTSHVDWWVYRGQTVHQYFK